MFINFHSEIRVDELVQSYRPFIKMLDGNQKTIQSPAILLKRKKIGWKSKYVYNMYSDGRTFPWKIWQNTKINMAVELNN